MNYNTGSPLHLFFPISSTCLPKPLSKEGILNEVLAVQLSELSLITTWYFLGRMPFSSTLKLHGSFRTCMA